MLYCTCKLRLFSHLHATSCTLQWTCTIYVTISSSFSSFHCCASPLLLYFSHFHPFPFSPPPLPTPPRCEPAGGINSPVLQKLRNEMFNLARVKRAISRYSLMRGRRRPKPADWLINGVVSRPPGPRLEPCAGTPLLAGYLIFLRCTAFVCTYSRTCVSVCVPTYVHMYSCTYMHTHPQRMISHSYPHPYAGTCIRHMITRTHACMLR